MLAGGLGTRLRPYTAVLPKPLVPVGEQPILELILAWLARCGVRQVDVLLGHLGQLIQTYFSQQGTLPAGLEVNWRWEGEPLGTAGALRLVPDVQETLLVVNGDVLTDLDPEPMLAFHLASNAALTIAAAQSSVSTELGVIEHSGDGIVSDYREKPVLSYTASIGVYLYEPRALEALPHGTCQFPELVLELLDRGERVAVYESDARWEHISDAAGHEAAFLRWEKWPRP